MVKNYILAFSLIVAASMANAFVNAAVRFDGYCDGFTGLTTEGKNGSAGTWQNLDCQGATATAGGAQVKNEKGEFGYAFGTSGAAALAGHEFVWVIRGDRTWSAYSSDGQFVNSGTWSPSPQGWASPVGGGRPSWQP